MRCAAVLSKIPMIKQINKSMEEFRMDGWNLEDSREHSFFVSIKIERKEKSIFKV